MSLFHCGIRAALALVLAPATLGAEGAARPLGLGWGLIGFARAALSG